MEKEGTTIGGGGGGEIKDGCGWVEDKEGSGKMWGSVRTVRYLSPKSSF